VDELRALRARREALLRAWLERYVLAGHPRVMLAARAAALATADVPRRWLDVARARYLAGGRVLVRLGIRVEPEPAAAEVVLGVEDQGLRVPACEVASAAQQGRAQ
jgi:hypothetical protein